MHLVVAFRPVVLDERALALYLHHSSKWKTAKDDMAATAWWRLWRRSVLWTEYVKHLRAAVDAQHEAFRFERVV